MSRSIIVWLCLTFATLISFLIVESAELQRSVATAAVLVIAFMKVRYVGLEFMELRTAPLGMRIAYEIWAVAVCGLMISLFLI